MVLGSDGEAVMLTGHRAQAGAGQCGIQYPAGQPGKDAVDLYNKAYGQSVSDIDQLFGTISDGGLGPVQVLFGNGFTYRVDAARSVLQRSTDFGRTFRDVLEGVYDLQVERVFVNTDGSCFVSEGDALCAGFTDDDYIGLRIGLVTFARAVDGLNIPPPVDADGEFSNRKLASAPKNRRYRGTFILTAARNRSGS